MSMKPQGQGAQPALSLVVREPKEIEMYTLTKDELRDLQGVSEYEQVALAMLGVFASAFVSFLVALLTSPPAQLGALAAFVAAAVVFGAATPLAALAWRYFRSRRLALVAQVETRTPRRVELRQV
jgi:hypothetical protein